MKFKLLHVYTLLLAAFVGSHAVSPEVYWKSVLPNSPMPKAIKDILYTDQSWDDGNEKVSTDDASMYIDQPEQTYSYVASKDEPKDHQGRFYTYAASKDDASMYIDQPEQTYSYVASKDEPKDHQGQFYRYAASKDDASMFIDQPEQTYSYVASKDEPKDHQGQFYRYAASKDDASMYIDQPEQTYSYVASKDELKDHHRQFYSYVTSKNQVKDHPTQVSYFSSMNHHPKDNLIAKLLFFEKDLQQGEEMKLHFMKNYEKIAFLPKKIADSIPFSSKDLPEIYNRLSVQPDSTEAKIVSHTLNLCEHKGIEGEELTCATSLESMIDFSTSKLGKRVKSLSTEVMNTKESTPSQTYKIELVRMLAPSKAVICHKQNYAYAVFYCHITVGTRSYAVSLEGADGAKVKSVAVCHNDTSKWNPKYFAFQLLKVKPGSVPICHFLPEEHILWVPY